MLAPVSVGQTLTVRNGYNHPGKAEPCPTPGPGQYDHCGNQAYGLDLVPSRSLDRRIIAPTAGSIALLLPGPTGPGCLLLRTVEGRNVTLCHFDSFEANIRKDARVVRGQILGLRDPGTDWVHISMDDRYAHPTKPYPAVAFSGDLALEGHELPPDEAVSNQYSGEEFVSTNACTTGSGNAGDAEQTDWSGGLGCWYGSGSWTTTDGQLVNDGQERDFTHDPTLIAPNQPGTPDYVVEVEIRLVRYTDEGAFLTAQGAFGANLRAGEGGNYQFAFCNGVGLATCGSDQKVASIGASGAQEALAQVAFDPGYEWHTYRFEVDGIHLRYSVDGAVLLEADDTRLRDPGMVALFANRAQILVRAFRVTAIS